jgi:hypothetical protein
MLTWLIVSSTHALTLDRKITAPSPSEEWMTLSTPHFRIHFVKQHKATAHQLAVIAEKAHSRLSPLLNWAPAGKTQVVLNDSVDGSNGASTPLPYNQLFLFMNTPTNGDLVSRDNWLEEVFTHEYAHILHNDQALGVPRKIRRIFGANDDALLTFASYPQLWAPHWVAEGIAIYLESLRGQGRNHSAIYNGKMREEVRRGLNSLTRESFEGYATGHWPFGHVYLYGAYFFQFIKETYGQEKVFEYITRYSDNLIPFRMDNRARTVFDKSGKALWSEFQQYLKTRFEPEIAQINSRGETPGTIIEAAHYFNRHITAGPDGSVFYYHASLDDAPEIRQAYPSGEVNSIIELTGVTFLDWHPKEGLLIGQEQVCENTKLFTDLLVLRENQARPVRITHCARMRNARWSHQGDSMFGVQTDGGQSTLTQITPSGKITPLYHAPSGHVIGDLSVSPDNLHIALQLQQPGIGWDIAQFSLTERTVTPLTSNPDIEVHPRYSADGKTLYYVSDHDGKMELRRQTLASNNVTTLTNTLGYIDNFTIDKHGAITVTEYTGSGERLKRIDDQSGTFGPDFNAMAGTSDALQLATRQPNQPAASGITPYHPLDSLRPRGWTPLFALNDQQDSRLGFGIRGSDVLGFHEWTLAPAYFTHQDIEVLGGAAFYNYYDRFMLSASRTIETSSLEDEQDTTAWDDERRAQLLLQKPWNHRDHAWKLAAGTAWERIKHHEAGNSAQYQDQITGLKLSFNNLRHYGRSISATDGIGASITLESYDLGMDSDHQGTAVITSLAALTNIRPNQTLVGQLLYGSGDDTIKPFSLGDAITSLESISGITQFGQRRFPLRGYKRQPELTGEGFLKATAEWRFPIATIYNGLFIPPVGLGRVHGATFLESAQVTRESKTSSWYSGLGLEVTTELLLGYDALTLPLTIGFAHGLDDKLGENSVYIYSSVQF